MNDTAAKARAILINVSAFPFTQYPMLFWLVLAMAGIALESFHVSFAPYLCIPAGIFYGILIVYIIIDRLKSKLFKKSNTGQDAEPDLRQNEDGKRLQ